MNDFSLNIDYASPAPEGLLVPQSSAAKQPKKRKSWGQALPEPKTSLPPRKRAKTDDEKEQRRIERIKRNRAAAHNSRERKRVEAERLEVENIHLKHQLAMMQQHLLRQNAQLAEFQRIAPNTLPQLSSEEFASLDFNTIPDIKDESSSSVGTPASSTGTIDPRASFSDSTPHEDMSTPFIKAESPCTSMMMMGTPSAPANGAKLDLTQHSAAMLCDLPCQSSRQSLMLVSEWWAQLILHLMHMNIMAFYKTFLAVSWTIWPARIARIMEMTSSPSTTSSTTCSRPTATSSPTTTRPTRSTRRQLRSAPSPTSTTPSSLLSYLSLLLQSQTSAQSFAKGLRLKDASAATRLALLSQLAGQRNGLVVRDGEDGAGFSHLLRRSGGAAAVAELRRRGRRRGINSTTPTMTGTRENQEENNGTHDDGGVG